MARLYWMRVLVVALISAVLVAAMNEGIYLIQREKNDRAPKTVQLVVPAGSAERVSRGEKLDSIPEEMVFVTGDVLEVKNEDVVDHQLGPVWVPAGSSGSLVLKEANNFSYACSFTPSKYLGLDVRKPTTLGTRLTALAVGAPSMGVFLFLYSLLVFPIKKTVQPGDKQ